MIYCLHCQKKVQDGATCPKCHQPLKKECTQEERTLLVQSLHRQCTKWGDKNDAAMTFLILGAIFLVIGAIFFKLSYKLDLSNPSDNARYLRTNTMEFFVAAASLGGGGLSFLYGLVQAIVDERHVRVLTHDIAYINEKLRLDPPSTPLWIKEFASASRVRILNAIAIHKANKVKKKP